MKKHEMSLLLNLYAYFAAALMIAVGQDVVYQYQGCTDSSYSNNSGFIFSCNHGRIIIVQSAIVGAADIFNPPKQCPITNNTCLKEITITVTELCTGRNSCDINQNVLCTDEWKLSCPRNGDTVGNFINVNYTCISRNRNYGDICHFHGDLDSNSSVYISSYPNFPDAMGPEVNYQCSCLLKSQSSLSSANVTIRAVLVKLTGADTCSERLSIVDSGNETTLEFCSPCNDVDNVTTVPLASDPVISFRRDLAVSPNNGKFIIEITASSDSSGNGSMGKFTCDFVGSTISSSTTVTTTSPSYSSTTPTTSAILNQSNSFCSTNVQNTSSEITRSHNTSIAPPTDDGTPAIAVQSASEKTSLSTGGIIGIVLGSVGLTVIVITVLLCMLRKQKQHCDHSKGNTNFTVQQSVTVIQNMQTTSNIELHETTSSELHTLQSSAHLSDEPQTTGYDNYCLTKDYSMSNYEEAAPVSDAKYGPGMIPTNEKRRFSHKMADVLTTEAQPLNSGDGDITLVENQLYGEYEKSMTDAVAPNDYAVVRLVVPDGRTDQSAEVDRGYAVVQMKNNSADHSYYNVPNHRGPTGSGTVQSPTEVSAETETNSASDEIQGTNPMYKADSDVILIDNALYGSMLTF